VKERPILGRIGVAGSTGSDSQKEDDEKEEEEEELASHLTISIHCNGSFDSHLHPRIVTSYKTD